VERDPVVGRDLWDKKRTWCGKRYGGGKTFGRGGYPGEGRGNCTRPGGGTRKRRWNSHPDNVLRAQRLK